MKKRIYLNIVALFLLYTLLLSSSLCLVFYALTRVQETALSFAGIFAAVLPVIIIAAILIMIFTIFIARRFTNTIAKPINEIDLDSDNILVYDELAPFVRKIVQKKNEIADQRFALDYRAGTIRAITESMKEGLIFVDRSGMILSANTSAQKIFDETDMVDRNILHICRDVDLLHKLKLCLSGESSKMSFERNDKVYNIYLSPVYYDNEIHGALILFLNTTERYRAERQRKQFSASVSHELKTPLTTISALAEMISNGMAKNEDVSDFAAKITGQTERLINIIDDIIRLSEFDEGVIEKEYSGFDLYELAVSVKTNLQGKADEKNVSLEVIGKPTQVAANEQMLDELLYNLVENGIKYNKDGGKVTITLSEEDGFHKISVADTGIGIPKKYHNRVFERFFRVDKSRSHKTGGTGLGLSIVKHIAEHHRGKVEMESAEDVGTTISCYIKE